MSSDVTAIAAGDSHSLFLKSDGSLWAMGDNGSGELGDGTTTNHQQSRTDRLQQRHRRLPADTSTACF